MRTPPEGTISREAVVGSPGHAAPGMVNGELVTRIPIPVTSELLARGTAPLRGRLLHLPRPASATATAWWRTTWPPGSRPRWWRSGARPAGFFFQAITLGYGLMPSFAGEISTDERWAVVAYVQALQLSQNAPVNSLPADVQRRLREGQTWSR